MPDIHISMIVSLDKSEVSRTNVFQADQSRTTRGRLLNGEGAPAVPFFSAPLKTLNNSSAEKQPRRLT